LIDYVNELLENGNAAVKVEAALVFLNIICSLPDSSIE